MRKDQFTKLLVLAIAFVSLSVGSVFAQSVAVSPNSLTTGSVGVLGAQCVGGIVYDDNTFENGYGWNPGYGIGKWAMLMTPTSYPFTINQICYGMTRTASGSANWTFDIEIYDNTGSGGAPGTLVKSFTNQVATNVGTWPTITWHDFTGLTGIPQLTSGSYYVALSWDPATMGSHYIAADESATTPLKSCYGYIQGAWALGTTYFPSLRALGIRCDGSGVTYAHNISVGPFLSLPAFFNVGTQKVIKAKITNLGTSNETGIPIKFFVAGTQVSSTTLNLNAGAVDSVSFNWTPTDTGTKNIRVVAALSNDEYRANDTVQTNVQVLAAGVVQTCVGTGTTAAAYPFYTFYMDSRTDMLYTAAELGNTTYGVQIFKIGYTVLAAYPQVMNGFKVKMQGTAATTVSSFTSSGWTEVFSGNYSIPGTGLQWITLASPFIVNSAQNLLVEICFNNSSYTSSSTVTSSTAASRVYHNHQDLSSGDGCVDITSGTVQTTLPNMCILGGIVGVNNGNNGVPKEFTLSQNYPNPFNPSTVINYSVPKASNVKLTVYDALGRVVTTLVNNLQQPGSYNVTFDGSNLSSGLYIYKMEAGDFTAVKKMLFVK